MPLTRAETIELLAASTAGDSLATEKLVDLVYTELRRLALHYLGGEAPNRTLQATELVHEAYIRLIGQKEVHWQNRSHFVGVAAQFMRRILIDRARKRAAAKRGARPAKVTLDEAVAVSVENFDEMLLVDQALSRLSAVDAQQGRIVELRYFGGLTAEETAKVLGISTATVNRDWNVARAWLYRELESGERS